MRQRMIGDGSLRKSRYDPNLADELRRDMAEEERLAKLRGKNNDAGVGEETLAGEEVIAPANISPREYIHVPQFNTNIAMRLTHKGEDMFDTLEGLLKKRLKMPSPARFIRHWLNVKEAASGGRGLVYADGSLVGDDVTKDLWNYMSSTDRSAWNGEIFWTWLDARFVKKKKKWYVETGLRVDKDGKGQRILKGHREILNCPVRKDGYVGLEFNEQGFPLGGFSGGKYQQGKNIYFWHPRDNCVARLFANSGRALFGCDGGPSVACASLGVVAEGDAQNFLGGER